MKTFLKIGISLLVAFLIALATLSLYLYFTTRTEYTGTYQLSGLNGKVTIRRDQWGVPHIDAEEDDHDAFFALGYVHAQDRFWQMEFQRRVAQGRLSEIFGSKTVSEDKFLRTIGFYRAAQSAWDALDENTQQLIHSYTQGINAYLISGHLPLEVKLLRYHPEPWTDIDSIAWQKLLAWDLQNTWEQKIRNALVTKQFGNGQVNVIFPSYPDDAPTVLSAADLQQSGIFSRYVQSPRLTMNLKKQTLDNLNHVLQFNQHMKLALGFDASGTPGSNSWVMSKRFSEDGHVYLASDPHLGLKVPSLWYLAELRGPQLHVMGATIPGLPAVILGHNDYIAWGATNVNPDVQDLYIESNKSPLTSHTENIKVKKRDTIKYEVQRSQHGPIINHIFPETEKVADNIALKWTALLPGDTTVQSIIKMNYAHNWREFVESLRGYITPSLNFLYADSDGNIGMYTSGKVPMRSMWSGSMPVPADGAHEWADFIPFAHMPHIYNPEAGYIASANNKIIPLEYPFQINFRWPEPPYRIDRFLDLFKAHQKLSMASMEEIQNDAVSYLWRELRPWLLQIQPKGKRESDAMEHLQNWDGNLERNSVAASIFNVWYRELMQHFITAVPALPDKGEPLFLIEQLRDQGYYCQENTQVNSCADLMRKTFSDTLAFLAKRLGPNVSTWRWGRLHTAYFKLLGLGDVPGLAYFSNHHIDTPGGNYTLNVGRYDFSNFRQHDGASYRQIIDLNDFDKSLFMMPMGQSGDLFNTHYADLLTLWRDGKYIPIRSLKESAPGVKEMVLKP